MKHTIFLFVLATLAPLTNAEPVAPHTLRSSTLRIENRSTLSFEEDWQVIDAYIRSHVIVVNSTVISRLKSETAQGYGTWLCAGNGLGWPSDPGGAVLCFDCGTAAETCASMIVALAENQSCLETPSKRP